MKNERAFRPRSSRDLLRRLVLFLFFLTGVLFSQSQSYFLFMEEELVPLLWQYALCFGAVLIFSASFWGIALIPGFSLLFGWLTEGSAGKIVDNYISGAGINIKGLLLNVAIVPLFFLSAERGMRISAALGRLADRYSQQERLAYDWDFIPMLLTVLVGIIFVFILIE